MERCDEHSLQVNVTKTKIIIDPKSIGDHTERLIHNQSIEQISIYKYLGVQMDNQMRWHEHVTTVCTKIHPRLYFLMRLRIFRISQNIMMTF